MNRAALPLAAVLSLALATAASACSVPVFRYALEHWPPDPYDVYVFHRGGLTDAQSATLRRVLPESLDEPLPANVRVELVDLDAADERTSELTALWEQAAGASLPWVVVRSPERTAGAPRVWSGELTDAHLERLLTSPLRETIARRLLEGESVVWVFLESGNREADDAAFETLTRELERLQATLKLPDLDPVDAADLSVAPEALKLSFSAVRLSRDDPAEGLLVEMLLSVEPDLRDPDLAALPMAFPVFGRGRALYALVGAGIVPDTIEDASRFLTGACQCTVKADNPGVDLLMAVDWERLVTPSLPVDTTAPPLIGLSGFSPDPAGATIDPSEATTASDGIAAPQRSEPAAASQSPDDDPSPAPTATAGDSHIVRNALLVLGLLGVLVVAATFLFRSRPE